MVDLDEAKLYCKIDFDFEDELKTVSFFNFSEFVRFILKVTKNKTNDNAYSVKMVTAFKDKWRDRDKLILKIMLF